MQALNFAFSDKDGTVLGDLATGERMRAGWGCGHTPWRLLPRGRPSLKGLIMDMIKLRMEAAALQ